MFTVCQAELYKVLDQGLSFYAVVPGFGMLLY